MVDLQLGQIDGLDTKAGFVLGAASFLVGGYAVLQVWAGSQQGGTRAAVQAHGVPHWGGLGKALLYCGGSGISFFAYPPGGHKTPPKPHAPPGGVQDKTK